MTQTQAARPSESTWILDVGYLALAVLVGPPYLFWRWLKGKKSAPLRRRLGFVEPAVGEGVTLWLHAVSVGEILAAKGLLEALRRRHPEVRLVLSATTATGLAVARATYPEVSVVESPLDFGPAVRRFFDRVRPDVLVLVELELWPNLLKVAAARGIPVVLANARLSEKSQRGYARLRRVVKAFPWGIRHVLCQDAAHAARFSALRWKNVAISVTGNLKFDNAGPRDPGPLRERLRAEHGYPDHALILIAGSTHGGEEVTLLSAWQRILREVPSARLVLVPRHPERLAEVFEQVSAVIGRWGTRSRPAATPDPLVLVVDTMGELSTFYALADVAFVGGTLVPVGGHNLLEPASLGLPLVVGPHLATVQATATALAAAGCLFVVQDDEELASTTLRIWRNAEGREQKRAAGLLVIQQNQGSVNKTVEALSEILGERGFTQAMAGVPTE